MNIGLVVGRVWRNDRTTLVTSGEVALTAIQGGSPVAFTGKDRANYASCDIGDDGRYIVSFAWSGAEFGSDLSNAMLYLYAGWEIRKENGYETISHNRVSTRGFVSENFSARLGLTMPNISSASGMASFAKDLIEAYRKIKSVPIPSIDWMSSECKIMFGAADIVLL